MPADYTSTARALALPISPLSMSPTPEQQSSRPPLWTRNRSSSNRPLGNPYRASSGNYKDQFLQTAGTMSRRIASTYDKMSTLQRILAAIFAVVFVVFGILFLLFGGRIFESLAPAAARWAEVRGGWLLFFFLNFMTAFPPIIGYSTTVTMAGFVYGMKGWFIVAFGTVAGSTCSFLASRTVLSSYVQRLVGEDKRFTALALTLKHDGLQILVMIRFCPLPYSLSNGAMSTFPGVNPLTFSLATAISTPKLLIPVFIGSRMAAIARDKEKNDPATKIINYVSIFLGIVLGAVAGYIIYRRTMTRAAQLDREEQEQLRASGLPIPREERVRGYTDGESGDHNDALMGEDDISLWENEIDEPVVNEDESYRDDFTDDEGNPFAAGDLDEEASVGSKTIKSLP